MKECDKVKRKIRKRTISVPREDGFICSICKAKGNCSDKKNSTDPFFWDEDIKKITCVNCGNRLTTKKELEEDLIVTEIQQYGFWLRFASEHFIPCRKCQDELHEMMMTETVAMNNQGNITIESLRMKPMIGDTRSRIIWCLVLRFLTCKIPDKIFRPCEKCQKRIQKIWKNKELHIGNETKPMVELWRKWDYIEDDKR